MSDLVKLGDVLLCEPGDALTLEGLDSARQVQVSPLLRAASAAVFGRGNRSLTLTLVRTRRPHATLAAARVYLADHEEELAPLSLAAQPCEFRFETASGVLVRWLRDCVLTGHRAQQRGLTTIHTYTLTGSRWSTTAA